jgi:N6-adenosine-specific RNA methylase IME4
MDPSRKNGLVMKYNIIYCDPPWCYRDKALAGKRGAGCKYQVHDTEWLKSIPIQNIAAKDCALFLWVTMPKMNEVFDLMSAWGFHYKTVAFTWIKKNKVSDSLFWGMGNYTRANAELCLLATKGKIERVNRGIHSVVYSKIEKHSKKPPEVRNRIVSLFGNLPRIELFATERVDGWDSIGNAIDGMDINDAISLL